MVLCNQEESETEDMEEDPPECVYVPTASRSESGQSKANEASTGQSESEQSKPDEVSTIESEAGQSKADEASTAGSEACQSTTDDVCTTESEAGQSKADEVHLSYYVLIGTIWGLTNTICLKFEFPTT